MFLNSSALSHACIQKTLKHCGKKSSIKALSKIKIKAESGKIMMLKST